MLDQMLVDFARKLAETSWSTGLHESFYMFNWIESTHVVTLMLSLGMLSIIDLRMLGWAFNDVPASKVANRLAIPMAIGFTIMVITGIILFTAIPVRYTQSIWFRFKLILLVAAAVNAILFHRSMSRSIGTWDLLPVAPKRIRMGAAISLSLWALIVIFGRFIAYDWYDCGKAENSAFIDWAAGCNVTPADETH